MSTRRKRTKADFRVFGIDYGASEVVTFEGERFQVETWYDALGKDAADPDNAAACVFQGPGGLWFAVDIAGVHFPEDVH